MNTLKKYLRLNFGGYALSVILALGGVIAGLVPYLVLARVLRFLLAGGRDWDFILGQVGLVAVCFIIKEVLASISTTVSHTVTYGVLAEIRRDLADKLFRMPLGKIKGEASGRLKNIIVDQVNSMETSLAHVVPEFTSSLGGSLLMLIYMFVLDWRLGLASLVPLAVGLFATMSMMTEAYQVNYKKSVEIGQRMNAAIVEYIGGVEVIKAFNQRDKSYKKYSDAVYENASFYYEWMKSSMMKSSIGGQVAPMGLITILPLGVILLLNGSLALADFVTIIVLSFSTIAGISVVFSYVDDLARISTILGQVDSIIEGEDLVQGHKTQDLESYDVTFEDISFEYEEGVPVLEGVSLEMKEGEVTALVGPSGGGKSTLTKLLAGFWNPGSGQVKIGGTPLDQIPLDQVAEMVSYVSQDNFLFDMTVRENIRIGRPSASDEEVEAMAKSAGCHDFIMDLEDGYETMTGEGGGQLSGGEKQRVSIARAMLKDAPIVVLDEATSYIDAENEAILQEAISRLVQGKTLIMIAHRLRTVTGADKIYVINGGQVEASGTHQDLLEVSPLYRDMYEASLGGGISA